MQSLQGFTLVRVLQDYRTKEVYQYIPICVTKTQWRSETKEILVRPFVRNIVDIIFFSHLNKIENNKNSTKSTHWCSCLVAAEAVVQ